MRGNPSASRVLLAIVSIGMAGCAPERSERPIAVEATIRVGVLPDESEAVLRSRYLPLLERLSESTGSEFELRIPESYDQLLEWFDSREIELAWFGGLTFVRASASGAVPIVMRDIDRRFTSEFLVASRSPVHEIEDARGLSAAFGPRLSTSGHLMPRAFLLRRGIDPEQFFADVRYSSGHDETVYWVRDRVVDLGVVNSAILQAMHADGRIDGKSLRRLETTPPFHNYTWAVQADLPEELVRRIRDAFLDLDPDDPEDSLVLAKLDAAGFLPSSMEDFAALRETAERLGLARP